MCVCRALAARELASRRDAHSKAHNERIFFYFSSISSSFFLFLFFCLGRQPFLAVLSDAVVVRERAA